MNEIKNNRQKKVYEIISIVKLASLLFCGIIILKYYFGYNNMVTIKNNEYFNIVSISTAAFIFVLIYAIWSVFYIRKFAQKCMEVIQIIEDCIFILIFLGLIILSGKNSSQYKFLFLFIIITSTIQSGMKRGILISSISSVVILTIDLIYGSSLVINQYFENDLILAAVFILTAWPLGYYVKIESDYIEKLSYRADIDGLTEVYNHRFFHESLKDKISISEKFQSYLSMILLDIDYFKNYNDLYGHQKGDEILKQIGSILKNNVRDEDVVSRYGGEEFAVILPDTDEITALSIAEKIRLSIEKYKFYGEENQPNGKITVSLGISTFPDKAKNDIELINSSDDALYRAKFFNKNRVETYYSILEELKTDIEAEHIDLITSIKTLISVINAKDRYTYAHIERVVMFSKLLGEKLQLTEEEKKVLKYGAYLHDIGKINISKEILNKKMPLLNEEWEILKQHPNNGVDIIEPVESLKNVIPLILHHHERYDGKGYPCGLKGKNIPYLARMLTVVDSFDAMTSNRPYNSRKSYEDAIEELKKCRGTQFDPIIVNKFIDIIEINKDKFDNLTFFSEK